MPVLHDHSGYAATKKSAPKEATALLRADHQEVSVLFAQGARLAERKSESMAER